MSFVMILLDRIGLLGNFEPEASRFDERLTRTCQREQMLASGGRHVRTPAERQAV
jgi:hypothetical protein